jgi:squalene-hopene/tetraprenyl-beta-curcumene cyclase
MSLTKQVNRRGWLLWTVGGATWSAVAASELWRFVGSETRTAKAVEGDVPAGNLDAMVNRAIAFLQSKGQAEDGSYTGMIGPGVTALVTTAILRHGRAPHDPVVAKSLKYLESFVREDGAVAKKTSRLPNYETCLAIMCFEAANQDGRYTALLKQADRYLKNAQIDEQDGKERSDADYGGAGYGGEGRPDLSNTAFLIDALKATGNNGDDKAIQRALLFVSRCQNLETELTIDKAAVKDPDGGFFYTVAAGGASPAGKSDEGALRSYGGMTYAGLKSMIYAGVKADDPRMQGALKWIARNYTVASNPGMGQAGVYYYYQTFAKTLDALGQDTVVDATGQKHDWRADLIAELNKRQQENGSWVNTDKRWMESDANLSTGFALLALSYCRRSPAKKS